MIIRPLVCTLTKARNKATKNPSNQGLLATHHSLCEGVRTHWCLKNLARRSCSCSAGKRGSTSRSTCTLRTLTVLRRRNNGTKRRSHQLLAKLGMVTASIRNKYIILILTTASCWMISIRPRGQLFHSSTTSVHNTSITMPTDQ